MKILAIGAHQDDNEFRVGGMASKWVKAGHEIRFLSLCNGCGGHHIMSPEETTACRAKESQAVAELLGVTYDVWDIPDCNIVADLEKNRLSYESPIGAALLNKKAGDEVQVKAFDDVATFKIVSIKK